MTGNEIETEQQNEVDVDQMTARAEAAARTAEAALRASQKRTTSGGNYAENCKGDC